jgi:hypothetical protein
LILSEVDSPKKAILPELACARRPATSGRSAAENCARIRDLGFTTSKHIKMYGERFELVSDAFVEGTWTSVCALSGNDSTIRILRLPTAILVGSSDRFRKPKVEHGR